MASIAQNQKIEQKEISALLKKIEGGENRFEDWRCSICAGKRAGLFSESGTSDSFIPSKRSQDASPET